MLNEEIPVNEWLKKIKYLKLGRYDVYSDYKELKFWVRLKCSTLYLPYILHIGKQQKGQRGQPYFTYCSNFCIIQPFLIKIIIIIIRFIFYKAYIF